MSDDAKSGAEQFAELHPVAKTLVLIICAALIIIGAALLAILTGWLWHGVEHAWS